MPDKDNVVILDSWRLQHSRQMDPLVEEDKSLFYQRLDALDEEEQEAFHDLEYQESIRLLTSSSSGLRQREICAHHSLLRLSRTSNVGTQPLLRLRRGRSFSPPKLATPMPIKEIRRLSRKRKLTGNSEIVPQAGLLFSGLNFYYCPNNDKDAARKMKIEKALQYGAVWSKEWCSAVTHIIADVGLTYDSLMKHLKLKEFPADVVIVTQKYQDECLQFGRLLDPDQRRYHLNGFILAAKRPKLLLPEAESQRRLSIEAEKTKSQGKPSQRNSQPKIGHEKQVNYTPKPAQPVPLSSTKVSLPSDLLTYNDELVEAITEAQHYAHLPLDLAEEDASMESDSHMETDAGSDEEKAYRFLEYPHSKKSWQDAFQCMQKHDGSSSGCDNTNARTIAILEQMGLYYDRIQDRWRSIAYRKAVSSLRKQTENITTKEQAFALPCIGARLAEKIEEIACTDRLRRLDSALLNPEDEALQKFLGIYGVGPNQASRWVSQGFKTLNDLVRNARLTENQKVGIAHYDDFTSRIPRAEVEQHGEFVRQVAQQVDGAFEVVIMGSYRRGASDSGDIDLIINKPGASLETFRATFIDTVIPKLFQLGFLKARLATSSRTNGSKWHGASALPGSGIWRRIDFLLVPSDEMGAALIYFTGNDIFNRSMRLLASKKGMRLNQRGLYKDCLRGRQRQKITEGTLLEGKSEMKIFEILGVPWRPPHHRIP